MCALHLLFTNLLPSNMLMVNMQIRSLAPLTSLSADHATIPPLAELYCAANKVAAIGGISGFSGLTLLELGSNRIRTMEGLEVNDSLLLLQQVAQKQSRPTVTPAFVVHACPFQLAGMFHNNWLTFAYLCFLQMEGMHQSSHACSTA
eukprot:GHRR01031216.1.p1 GENE.GHRR01031216.1~~GHRR01031216.1.p1  ORF type:complete len:147 (+),score=26.86 GHRR01031216.1:249-689(+)